MTVTEEAQDGRPDKKVYSLTKAGETALRRACDIDPEPDQIRSDLLFLIFFARYQSPAKIARLVDERIAFYEARQRALDECAMDDTADPGMILFAVSVWHDLQRRCRLFACQPQRASRPA